MLGRRGVLGGALGLLALAACDTDDLRPPEDDETPVASPTPGATGTPEPDADQTLVDSVVTAILGADTVVTRARQLPRLKRPLASLSHAHAAHLDILDAHFTGDEPAPPAAYRDALAEVRTTEERLQRTLTSAATTAQSGALARLLASMSASVAQHVAVLPASGPTNGGPPR